MSTYQSPLGSTMVGSVNFDATADPYSGTTHIVSNTSQTTGINALSNTPFSVQDFPRLYFMVKFNRPLNSNENLLGSAGITSGSGSGAINFLSGSLSSIDKSNTTDYQQVIFPTASFNIPVIEYIHFRMNGNSSPLSYQIDDIFLTGEYSSVIVNNELKVENNSTLIGPTPTLNFVDGQNTTVEVTEDAINNKVNIAVNSIGGGSVGPAKTITLGEADLTTYTGTTKAKIVGYINDLNYSKTGDLWIEYTGVTTGGGGDPIFYPVLLLPVGASVEDALPGWFLGVGPDPQVGDVIYIEPIMEAPTGDVNNALPIAVVAAGMLPPTFEFGIVGTAFTFIVDTATTSEIIQMT